MHGYMEKAAMCHVVWLCVPHPYTTRSYAVINRTYKAKIVAVSQAA